MAPKKDKGKKEEEKVGTFNEVEKTFLELQVTEGNRKIARLRTALDEFEARNEELQKAYDTLDEDRADIIAYLKKTVNIKNEENSELKEKVKGLEEIREIENAQFHTTVSRLEKDFTVMKEQLTSENKLLAGKINTLEEFRAIRDDLMKKFEKQEKDFEDQEMKYKRIIYESEKKFVIGKDKLKKEMEARLLQLAQDFQDATELRVAASTHRVIRENIAISNELDNILFTQKKVAEQNEQYKDSIKKANIAKELAEEERDKAINKNVIQLKVIEQLTTAFENVKKEKILFEKKSYDFEKLQLKIDTLTKANEKLAQQVRILEQNLHTKITAQNKALVEASKMSEESNKLRKVLQEAALVIQGALKLDQWANADPARVVVDKQFLLSHLLEIVSQYREIHESASVATIASFSRVYEEGDLGFIPKTPLKKKKSIASAPLSHTSQQDYDSKSEAETIVDSKSLSTDLTSSAKSNLAYIASVPAINVIPVSETKHDFEAESSIESFIVLSQSEPSTVLEEEKEEKTDIEIELMKSKIAIQKSIMKDLAIAQAPPKLSIDIARRASELSKRVTIVESIENIETVQEVTELSEKEMTEAIVEEHEDKLLPDTETKTEPLLEKDSSVSSKTTEQND